MLFPDDYLQQYSLHPQINLQRYRIIVYFLIKSHYYNFILSIRKASFALDFIYKSLLRLHKNELLIKHVLFYWIYYLSSLCCKLDQNSTHVVGSSMMFVY